MNAIKCLLRKRVRSTVVILCLIALLSPFVTAISICEGIKSQYREMLNQAGDVYITGDNYGSNAPIDLEVIEHLQRIQGVTQVVPRVIGRTYVKGKFLAILGIDPGYIPASIRLAEGRAHKAKGDVIIGRGASEYLNLGLGSRFSIKRRPGQVFQIVGLFHSPFNIWNVDLLVMGYED
ncbi:MAG: ABC transporter permease, partial [Desulfobacterales bacterium]|nr:ABC transporter permease [Desulfobacterales bacterium]